MVEVEVICLVKDLLEYIEIDVENLEMGSVIYFSDIKFFVGVEIWVLQLGEDYDLLVVSVSVLCGGVDEEVGDDEELVIEE